MILFSLQFRKRFRRQDGDDKFSKFFICLSGEAVRENIQWQPGRENTEENIFFGDFLKNFKFIFRSTILYSWLK